MAARRPCPYKEDCPGCGLSFVEEISNGVIVFDEFYQVLRFIRLSKKQREPTAYVQPSARRDLLLQQAKKPELYSGSYNRNIYQIIQSRMPTRTVSAGAQGNAAAAAAAAAAAVAASNSQAILAATAAAAHAAAPPTFFHNVPMQQQQQQQQQPAPGHGNNGNAAPSSASSATGASSSSSADFQPDRPIGYGAFGVVWSVTDPRDGKRVALKKLPNVFQSLVSSKRVFRELKMMRFFKHENVLSCLDILQVSPAFVTLHKPVSRHRDIFAVTLSTGWCKVRQGSRYTLYRKCFLCHSGLSLPPPFPESISNLRIPLSSF